MQPVVTKVYFSKLKKYIFIVIDELPATNKPLSQKI
jgi:hypothetical protein